MSVRPGYKQTVSFWPLPGYKQTVSFWERIEGSDNVYVQLVPELQQHVRCAPPLLPSLSHTLSLTHTQTRCARPRTRATHILSLSLSRALSPSLTHRLSLAHSLMHPSACTVRSASLSLSLTHSLSRARALTHTPTHTRLSLSHTRTHTDSLTHPSSGAYGALRPEPVRRSVRWGHHLTESGGRRFSRRVRRGLSGCEEVCAGRCAHSAAGSYRGTSLIRKRTPLGPCRSYGGVEPYGPVERAGAYGAVGLTQPYTLRLQA